MPTALIIDDKPEHTDLLQSYLKVYNIESFVAHTGKEGFEYAKALQPNVILCDLRMPQETWDGYKTISELKSNSTTKHIPVIVVTASGDLEQARKAGCDEILMRPFRTNRFLDVLQKCLGNLS